jgi:hypothetical protein
MLFRLTARTTLPYEVGNYLLMSAVPTPVTSLCIQRVPRMSTLAGRLRSNWMMGILRSVDNVIFDVLLQGSLYGKSTP